MKRTLIFVHRWLGVALCLLFLLWFPSGIGMMYWPFPGVTADDRIERSPALEVSRITLSPAEAYARISSDGEPPPVVLNTFDGRPVYRFGGDLGGAVVYADTGDEQREVSTLMVRRIASAWSGKPIGEATVDRIREVDQWTVQENVAALDPLWKFSWPDGEQVYVSQATGAVIQHTTTGSRIGAYLGPIPHWFYFTPLRKHGSEWSRVVIWSSGIATIAAILGVILGASMYSPSRRYRRDGAASAIPYRGQKRWHMVLGLVFGIATATWAFSGMLSMDPFPTDIGGSPASIDSPDIPDALRGRMQFASFAAKHPREALAQLDGLPVKELELATFAGTPLYLASLGPRDTRIVPVTGEPMDALAHDRVLEVVRQAGAPGIVDARVITEYDRYYLDRHRRLPLPVIVAEVRDAENTRYYIDPRTARVVGDYRSRDWVNRWVYNGLHSLNFPWLYNYRPLWDIIVIGFMLGGTGLGVTSLVLAWRVVGRRLRGIAAEAAA